MRTAAPARGKPAGDMGAALHPATQSKLKPSLAETSSRLAVPGSGERPGLLRRTTNAPAPAAEAERRVLGMAVAVAERVRGQRRPRRSAVRLAAAAAVAKAVRPNATPAPEAATATLLCVRCDPACAVVLKDRNVRADVRRQAQLAKRNRLFAFSGRIRRFVSLAAFIQRGKHLIRTHRLLQYRSLGVMAVLDVRQIAPQLFHQVDELGGLLPGQ